MPAKKTKRWSRRVTETSDVLDLDKGVFSLDDPRKIALSLKRSADRSRRRKADPFRSAMSMLNFISTAPAVICHRTDAAGSKRRKENCAACTAKNCLNRPRQASPDCKSARFHPSHCREDFLTVRNACRNSYSPSRADCALNPWLLVSRCRKRRGKTP